MAVDDGSGTQARQRATQLADRLEEWISNELAPIVSALRRADPVIPCGLSDPDPRIEYRIAGAREALEAPGHHDGCGRLLVLWNAFRCVECGRWFHRSCIERHFQRHRTHEPDEP